MTCSGLVAYLAFKIFRRQVQKVADPCFGQAHIRYLVHKLIGVAVSRYDYAFRFRKRMRQRTDQIVRLVPSFSHIAMRIDERSDLSIPT